MYGFKRLLLLPCLRPLNDRVTTDPQHSIIHKTWVVLRARIWKLTGH